MVKLLIRFLKNILGSLDKDCKSFFYFLDSDEITPQHKSYGYLIQHIPVLCLRKELMEAAKGIMGNELASYDRRVEDLLKIAEPEPPYPGAIMEGTNEDLLKHNEQVNQQLAVIDPQSPMGRRVSQIYPEFNKIHRKKSAEALSEAIAAEKAAMDKPRLVVNVASQQISYSVTLKDPDDDSPVLDIVRIKTWLSKMCELHKEKYAFAEKEFLQMSRDVPPRQQESFNESLGIIRKYFYEKFCLANRSEFLQLLEGKLKIS